MSSAILLTPQKFVAIGDQLWCVSPVSSTIGNLFPQTPPLHPKDTSLWISPMTPLHKPVVSTVTTAHLSKVVRFDIVRTTKDSNWIEFRLSNIAEGDRPKFLKYLLGASLFSSHNQSSPPERRDLAEDAITHLNTIHNVNVLFRRMENAAGKKQIIAHGVEAFMGIAGKCYLGLTEAQKRDFWDSSFEMLKKVS